MTSKHDIERRLDDIEGDSDDETLEEASIHTMLSSINAGEHDRMEEEPGIVRCFGQLYRVPDLPPGIIDDLEGDDSSTD